MLITTNQVVTPWATVFGDEVLAATILHRLLDPTLADQVRDHSVLFAWLD